MWCTGVYVCGVHVYIRAAAAVLPDDVTQGDFSRREFCTKK